MKEMSICEKCSRKNFCNIDIDENQECEKFLDTPAIENQCHYISNELDDCDIEKENKEWEDDMIDHDD